MLAKGIVHFIILQGVLVIVYLLKVSDFVYPVLGLGLGLFSFLNFFVCTVGLMLVKLEVS